MTSIKALFLAWRKFSHGKSSRSDVKAFRLQLTNNIKNLHKELSEGTYQHGSYQPFTVFDPKQRSIHKAAVRDRLVHQAVVSEIEPIFEKRFIYDSYSCRAGKGTHNGVRRLRHFLQKASRNNTKTVYILKCDIRKFFDSIDHGILLKLLKKRATDEKTLELLNIIIKSFERTPGKGLPLGNVTSQLFANVYLHELDFFVKHILREKYYLRYCDDFAIISTDKNHLLVIVDGIREFLRSELAVDLHPHKVSIQTYHHGVDFLGYVLKPGVTLVRRVTEKRILNRSSPKIYILI